MFRKSFAIVPIALAALACIWPIGALAQSEPDPQAETALLVAMPAVGEAWREVVLVSWPYRGGHLGLILNRPLPLRLKDFFPRHEPALKVPGPVYLGGPANQEIVYALAELEERPPRGVLPLMGNVYLLVHAVAIDKQIAERPAEGRYFAGVTAWRPGELAQELRRGWWKVRAPSAAILLREDPVHLWDRLRPRSTVQLEVR